MKLVIAEKPSVGAAIAAALGVTGKKDGYIENKRRCSVCGAAFASTSNNVKYCPDCRKYITRRQAAERMRKKRALVTK